MHREILNAETGLEVDHINGDRLDNRRSNLRLVTRKQNSRNLHKKKPGSSSRYYGVYYNGKKWIANIEVDNKTIYLGSFNLEKDAAIAYNKCAKQHKFLTKNILITGD